MVDALGSLPGSSPKDQVKTPSKRLSTFHLTEAMRPAITCSWLLADGSQRVDSRTFGILPHSFLSWSSVFGHLRKTRLGRGTGPFHVRVDRNVANGWYELADCTDRGNVVIGISSCVRALFVRVRALPKPADGERLYAIGDLHGRFDLFRILIKQLEADAAGREKIPTRIILLGDLIDRGPRSRDLLVLVKRMQLQNRDRFVVLCGNHEEMLLASADGSADAQRLWLENGGDATLRSYGLDPAEFIDLTPEQRGGVLWRAVGADMLVWLAALPVRFRSGDYFFCHAGVRPGLPLDNQRRDDLLWIRRDFVNSDRRHGAIVVHGHSEASDVEVKANRINVDTAAYRTGQLTAVGLQGPYRWFISTAQRYLNRADLDAAFDPQAATGGTVGK